MEISFEDYYSIIISELKKNGKRGKEYFDNLDLLLNNLIFGDDYTEIEKIEILKRIVYSNGSMSFSKLKKIDKEFGIDKYYEENC